MKPKELVAAFKAVGLKPEYKIGDWLNIARPDGVHCEFYPAGPRDEVFCATYTIKGKETDLDFYLPQDLGLFVGTVCEILNHKPKRKSA